jgi:hypothetical protein
MTLIPSPFDEFLRSLVDRHVDYLLIGGYAVIFHGYVRSTGDIDVWVRMEPGNAERVVAALTDFGFGVPELTASTFLSERCLVRMGVPPFRIEMMTSIPGVTFEECWPGRVESTWDGVPVTVIGLECLKKNKRATGRLKDLADLDYLP